MIIIICFTLGILSILYSFIVMGAGSGTLFHLFWMFLGIVFIGLGAMSYFRLWIYIPKMVKVVIGFFAIIGIVIFILVECMIVQKFTGNIENDLDYIIILGAQVREDGPSVVLKYRLDEAINYLNENEDTICIVSGGKGLNEPITEAEGMATYLYEHGIHKDDLILENQSTTTFENMKFSKALISKNSKVGIVTNDFHMFRALLIAKNAGITDVYPVPAKSTKIFLPNNMTREFFALIKYVLINKNQ